MQVKQLPLVESPIRGYMMYSYHLGVTFSHINAWPWFFTNYVQLQCKPEQLQLSDFLDCTHMAKGEIHFTEGTSPYNPWLSGSTRLDQTTIDESGWTLSRYVVDSLKNDFYVETYIDEYYIPALFNGETNHFGHRLLVFGFDEARQTFDIIGFDKNSQYKRVECSYAALDAAFTGITPQIPERTRLFKPSAAALPASTFDASKFVNVLNEYLSSKNTLLNPDLRGDLKADTELWYGLRTYDFLGEYVKQSIEAKSNGVNTGLDFRGFHTMWEHKKCMLDRLKWLTGAGYHITEPTLTQYAKVVSLSEIACSRVVMCRRGLLPPGKGHLDEVPRLLQTAKTVEADALHAIAEIVTRQRGKFESVK